MIIPEPGVGAQRGFPGVRKPEWHIQASNFSLRFEVLDGNVLHGIATGRFKGDYIEPVFHLNDKVINTMGLDSGPYYYLLGLTGIDGAGQKARKRYVRAISQFQRSIPSKWWSFTVPTNWSPRRSICQNRSSPSRSALQKI